MNPALLYFTIISAISVAVTILDKVAARLHALRVPEAVLFLLAALGGSLSMYITMFIIRHKTLHPKFRYGIPVIIALQIAALLFAVWQWNEMHA